MSFWLLKVWMGFGQEWNVCLKFLVLQLIQGGSGGVLFLNQDLDPVGDLLW